MQEDKSTWTKIEGTVNDMVTKLITIKGEKYDAKEAFKDIDVIIWRKNDQKSAF